MISNGLALNTRVTANRFDFVAATSPVGSSDAWKVTKNNVGGSLFRNNVDPIPGGTYRFSIWAKATETSSTASFTMDISDKGTVSHVLTNEWVRYSVVVTDPTRAPSGDFIDIA